MHAATARGAARSACAGQQCSQPPFFKPSQSLGWEMYGHGVSLSHHPARCVCSRYRRQPLPQWRCNPPRPPRARACLPAGAAGVCVSSRRVIAAGPRAVRSKTVRALHAVTSSSMQRAILEALRAQHMQRGCTCKIGVSFVRFDESSRAHQTSMVHDARLSLVRFRNSAGMACQLRSDSQHC